MYTYTYIYIYIYVLCVYIYIYIHIHTYIHTYTYIHVGVAQEGPRSVAPERQDGVRAAGRVERGGAPHEGAAVDCDY